MGLAGVLRVLRARNRHLPSSLVLGLAGSVGNRSFGQNMPSLAKLGPFSAVWREETMPRKKKLGVEPGGRRGYATAWPP